MNRLSFLPFLTLLPLAASAQVVFSDNFNSDTSANWNFNSVTASGNAATFAFDYSALGIPVAPHTTDGSTKGLKIEANYYGTTLPAGALGTGASLSPIGLSLSGDYTLQFDAYQQSIGPFPASGSGSTQILLAGIGSPATQAQSQFGTINGLAFGSVNDSGSSVTYRAYNGSTTANNGATFAAGAQAYSNAYYSGFQGTIPAIQTTNYPSYQTGTPRQGTLGMAWHTWNIAKLGSTVTWTVDSTLIATSTIPTAGYAGSDIFIGQSDTNATASSVAASRDLNFGLIDNVKVTQAVPEPSAFAALGLGALAFVRRRRK